MSVKEVVLTLNGQNYALRKNTEGEYEAVITAPEESGYTQPEHAYVMELRITDQSGTIVIDKNHDTFGSKMKLAVVERVPPVISPVFPTESAYLTERTVQIQFDVTDDDSGVKKDTISLQIDAGTMLTKQLTEISVIEGYHCTYVTALKEGVHILRIKAEDRDGNAIKKIVTFKVDTTAPSLNISEPSDHIALNVPTCRIVGITNDTTSAPLGYHKRKRKRAGPCAGKRRWDILKRSAFRRRRQSYPHQKHRQSGQLCRGCKECHL